jgi:hypothetical protein
MPEFLATILDRELELLVTEAGSTGLKPEAGGVKVLHSVL